jgi:hypothetical protein
MLEIFCLLTTFYMLGVGVKTTAKMLASVFWRMMCSSYPGFWKQNSDTRWIYRLLFHWKGK